MPNEHAAFRVKLWGVRGSIPTPAMENLGFGGNTTSIEIRSGDEILIIDSGSGVRKLGLSLTQEFPAPGSMKLAFLFTHFHWDHIQGLPLFAPLYSASSDIEFHACRPSSEVEEILRAQMANPYYPYGFGSLKSKRTFVEHGREAFRHGSFTVHPFPLNHPQGAHGYRIEKDGAVYVHACDTEHGDPALDRILREYSQDADVLLMDTQYTPEEYESKRGWGHSTWLEATKIARDAKVEKLILFHHDPTHDDRAMRNIELEAQRQFENTIAAVEESELILG